VPRGAGATSAGRRRIELTYSLSQQVDTFRAREVLERFTGLDSTKLWPTLWYMLAAVAQSRFLQLALLLALVGCARELVAPKAPRATTVVHATGTPEQKPAMSWLEVLARHAPALADRLRECAAGDCEVEAFSWCDRWTARKCRFRHPREGSIRLTRGHLSLHEGEVSISMALEEVSISISHDRAKLFEDLARIPSVVLRDDERLDLGIGATTHLVAWKHGDVELYKVTPLSDLPELLDGMRSERFVARSLRPTRLHLERDEFWFHGFREQRGTTTYEAGFTCIPVGRPGDENEVMAALSRRWGNGKNERIELRSGRMGMARVFERGWVVADLRTYTLPARTSQLLVFYGGRDTGLFEIDPACAPDEFWPEPPVP
jgi:hypothetical protein